MFPSHLHSALTIIRFPYLYLYFRAVFFHDCSCRGGVHARWPFSDCRGSGAALLGVWGVHHPQIHGFPPPRGPRLGHAPPKSLPQVRRERHGQRSVEALWRREGHGRSTRQWVWQYGPRAVGGRKHELSGRVGEWARCDFRQALKMIFRCRIEPDLS